MSDHVFVKPAEGMRVRDPMRNYSVLPSKGQRVPLNGFWQRRVNCGDVEIVKEAKRSSKSKPTEEKKSTEGSE